MSFSFLADVFIGYQLLTDAIKGVLCIYTHSCCVSQKLVSYIKKTFIHIYIYMYIYIIIGAAIRILLIGEAQRT